MDDKSVLITGCDSGFGLALAKHLHKLGFTVFAGCLLKVMYYVLTCLRFSLTAGNVVSDLNTVA